MVDVLEADSTALAGGRLGQETTDGDVGVEAQLDHPPADVGVWLSMTDRHCGIVVLSSLSMSGFCFVLVGNPDARSRCF